MFTRNLPRSGVTDFLEFHKQGNCALHSQILEERSKLPAVYLYVKLSNNNSQELSVICLNLREEWIKPTKQLVTLIWFDNSYYLILPPFLQKIPQLTRSTAEAIPSHSKWNLCKIMNLGTYCFTSCVVIYILSTCHPNLKVSELVPSFVAQQHVLPFP